MAIKADYVLRETGTNLFRNFSITIASILTISVSLFLFGVSLMLSQGVNNATRQWQGGRVVYDALGHASPSLDHPVHRRVVARAALWALGRSDDEIRKA